MKPVHTRDPQAISRRWFTQQCGVGLGSIALGNLMGHAAQAGKTLQHFPAKAKRVIYLFMAGAPSQFGVARLQADPRQI